MNITVNYIKYSIFGKYESLDATPDNITRLYGIFGPKGFLPNILQLIQIEQPNNNINTITRPQFIHQETNCTISILPDRIDIQANKDSSLPTSIEYFNQIIDLFKLSSSRIALNTNLSITDLKKEELENLKSMFLNKDVSNYDELIEWSIRCVSRKHIESINEQVNIGENIQYNSTLINGTSTDIFVYDTDINTLAHNNKERFDIKSIRDVFDNLITINTELTNKFKVN